MAALMSDVDSPPLPSSRPKILCIDDDPDISQAIKFQLEPYGVDVFRAFDGMPGYWTALTTRPDVIICDMVMPDGEGNYLLSRFRSSVKFPQKHCHVAEMPQCLLQEVSYGEILSFVSVEYKGKLTLFAAPAI